MRLLLFQSKRNGGGGGDGGDSVGGTADIEAAAALSASAVAAAEPSNDPPSVAAAAHNTSRQAEKRATHCSPSVATPAAGGVDDGTMNEKKEENCRRVEGTVDTVALNGSVHDNDGSALGMDSSLQTEHAHPAVDDDEDLDAILETMGRYAARSRVGISLCFSAGPNLEPK